MMPCPQMILFKIILQVADLLWLIVTVHPLHILRDRSHRLLLCLRNNHVRTPQPSTAQSLKPTSCGFTSSFRADSRHRPQLVLQSAGDGQERRSPGLPSSMSYRDRDNGGHTQGPPYTSGVPSGPRSHFPLLTPRDRDTKHADFPQNLRAPPSGPSRSSRDQFYPNESPTLTLRDRDVAAVDILPQSRAPFRPNDTHIRPGTGMYADREQGLDLPKAPRAMSSAKTPTNSTYPPQSSPTSPTLFVERNAVLRDRPPAVFRERSPPPPINSEGWERHRDGPGRLARSDSVNIREEPPAWRTNSRWDDAGRRRPEPDHDASQVRLPLLFDQASLNADNSLRLRHSPIDVRPKITALSNHPCQRKVIL